MFLEKHSRFFRRYELVLGPRNKAAPYLDLLPKDGKPSVFQALAKRISAQKALEVQPNGDIVELMKINNLQDKGVLVLLFHRVSPNAADPIYRKKAREAVTLRPVTREAGEVPAVSAHMIIKLQPISKGRHMVALEEIPGLSMGPVATIIRHALSEYRYTYDDGKGESYCVVKAEGIKSETIEGALKNGRLDVIRLVRPAKPDFVDAEGLFQPTDETMTLKIKGTVDGATWIEKLNSLVTDAKAEGWTEFKIDIDLENKRSRTVKLDRDESAKEILFVRSDYVPIAESLAACSLDIVIPVVDAAIKLINSK